MIPMLVPLQIDDNFYLSLFRGMYVFSLKSFLKIDAATAKAIFTIERTNKPIETLTESELNNVPSFGEILEILEKTYLTEFLIGMTSRGYPILEKLERNLIVNPDKNTAYIEIKTLLTSNITNPTYDDFFTIYGTTTDRSVDIGMDTYVDWTKVISMSVSRPFYRAEIDLNFDFTKIRKSHQRFNSRTIDMARFYFAFVDPVIQTIAAYAVGGDVPQNSYTMSDYLRFNLDLGIAYNETQMHIIIHAVPNQALKHKIYWTGDSSFTIEANTIDDYSEYELDRDECLEIAGTLARTLVPMVFTGPKGIIQYGNLGYHFRYDDEYTNEKGNRYVNQIVIPYGLDSQCDTNNVFYYCEEITPHKVDITDREFNETYHAKTKIIQFNTFDTNAYVVFGNPDPNFEALVGLLKVDFNKYLDINQFRTAYLIHYDSSAHSEGEIILPKDRFNEYCDSIGLQHFDIVYLRPHQSFPYSRVYQILAKTSIKDIKVPGEKPLNFKEDVTQKDIINMKEVANKKKSGFFNFLRGGN